MQKSSITARTRRGSSRRLLGRAGAAAAGVALLALACVQDVEDGPQLDSNAPRNIEAHLTVADKMPRYEAIRDSARARGIGNAYLLAGIANTESGLAQCWSEATWACAGPSSPDCGGGPVIAGAADGPCGARQGGLGMFQFDAGTYDDTLSRYGQSVVTVDGQVASAIDYVVNMVKISAYTTNAETDDKARDWINNFDVDNATLRDQWIKTVVRYYNGCQPGWSCWDPRLRTYSDGMWAAVQDPGVDFWGAAGGGETQCGSSPAVVGAIAEKYRALGGCDSFLGAPISEEASTSDGVGRVSDFEHGSIYWTPDTGAFEVHGAIRDKWRALGAEGSVLGYPTTDEGPALDDGRYNHFENGSIYWTPAGGAFEVHGAIHDAWEQSGWEQGALGFPVSDEYDVADGRRSDFERGSIAWNGSTGEVAVVADGESAPRWKVLPVDYQIQETSYWCGPAATRAALSARVTPAPTQAALAGELGTTTNGTDWIGQVTGVLNDHLGAGRYQTVEMPDDPPTQAQRDRLWQDVTLSIDNGYALVANIVAPPNNHPPGYPSSTIYHYFTVAGYNPDTREVYIADSANFSGQQLYWLSFDQLATLIPPKGYATYR